MAFAEAIREAKGGKDEKDKDKHASIDSLLSDLPATKAAAAVKKAVRKSVKGDEGKRSRKKKKQKGRSTEEDEESKKNCQWTPPTLSLT